MAQTQIKIDAVNKSVKSLVTSIRARFRKAPAPDPFATQPRKQDRETLFFEGARPFDEFLKENQLWEGDSPLRLHLGCGQKGFDGYINVDYPSDKHTVMKNLPADVFADVLQLKCSPGSVSEIRLHHVFEHFSRVSALAQILRWSDWLKVGGHLIVETPDLEGLFRTFLRTQDHKVRMGLVRHIVGDQSSEWGYHLDQWWGERYRQTLETLGYTIEAIRKSNWPTEPWLSDVLVKARLDRRLSPDEALRAAEAILRQSMVHPSEEPTLRVWIEQLQKLLTEAKS